MSSPRSSAAPIIGESGPTPTSCGGSSSTTPRSGFGIEQETGLVASPMMKMHHEGFGRIILTAGRLVVLSKHLRDVHRFGFDSIAALAAAGTSRSRPASR